VRIPKGHGEEMNRLAKALNTLRNTLKALSKTMPQSVARATAPAAADAAEDSRGAPENGSAAALRVPGPERHGFEADFVDLHGADFFRSVLNYCAQTIGAEHAFITRRSYPSRSRVKTVAYLRDGERGENFEYDLTGTPCEKVLNEGRVLFYPRGLRNDYPEENMESYLGIPIHEGRHATLGHLVCLSSKPLPDDTPVDDLAALLTNQAADELRSL
jgi:GAF domain